MYFSKTQQPGPKKNYPQAVQKGEEQPSAQENACAPHGDRMPVHRPAEASAAVLGLHGPGEALPSGQGRSLQEAPEVIPSFGDGRADGTAKGRALPRGPAPALGGMQVCAAGMLASSGAAAQEEDTSPRPLHPARFGGQWLPSWGGCRLLLTLRLTKPFSPFSRRQKFPWGPGGSVAGIPIPATGQEGGHRGRRGSPWWASLQGLVGSASRACGTPGLQGAAGSSLRETNCTLA